ncbi:putative toxin-antitoxin system toxin component, PIN family [Candidatus Synechococcus calcipolaris G9]|uniref:Toxin-antitoxin system toxin component, PIN family n=1 Tax=Candidatus Synechococcus calcipolaris G9 TaxID=1497997 RepID=A0ABT6EYZ0_9SYNE|nr:putative toxin-antitoxin system toxin component, PIN family [Candidatus Synechococcus calcipolaris]MDG2990681.1 putative toxin-antitoxin system toxin component, PIN family [Candidatus Synechococcus calcipolaris G9]
MGYVAVFDTNIFLSALLSTNGHPFRCLALAKIGQVESITCQEILDELAEKLLMKFKFSEDMTQSAVKEVRDFSRLVKISGTLKVVPDDPDDDMIVECAVVGNATHIVTGDKHLLALTNYQDIVILKAAEFVALLVS